MSTELRRYFNQKLDWWGKERSEEEEDKIVAAINKIVGVSHATPTDERWETVNRWLGVCALKRAVSKEELVDWLFARLPIEEVVKKIEGLAA
ncbi:MAG: hypothetical protein V1696_02085 [Candidatus Jorgensenbacteria bacterium]